jgi:glycosyltransferase involved in cell wall biosynthesis
MTVAGISMMKDEADIVETTVGAMLRSTDFVIVADNGSTDGTRDLLADMAKADDRLEVRDDDDPAYYQAAKMTALAAAASERGAEWVVPFDADEVWYSPFGRIADVLTDESGASIASAQMFDHVASGLDADIGPVERIGWRRRAPTELLKVAAKARPAVNIHQGNHDADHGHRVHHLLVIRHFPYRSVEQFVSKVRNGAAAYAATDLPKNVGAHWREYGEILKSGGEEALADVFRTWYWEPNPKNDAALIFDPCPTP